MIEQPQLTDKLQEIKKSSDQLTHLVLSAAEEGRAVDAVEQDLWNGLMQLGANLLGVTGLTSVALPASFGLNCRRNRGRFLHR